MLDDIIAEELKKEARIRRWWEQTDREVVFREYCNPGEKTISLNSLKKYFTER